ncbi:MAG: hypothetical protein NVSMB12_15790 [Acidimicrobiales bacterium]
MRPSAIVALAAFVITAACGAKGTGSSVSPGLIPATTTIVGPGAPTTPPPGPATTRLAATSAPPGRAPAAVPYQGGPQAGSGNGGFAAATPPPAGTDPAALGGSGSYARVLLHPLPAKAVQVELLEQSGAVPNATALDYDIAMIRKVTQKPVAVGKTIPVPGGPAQWTPQAMATLVDHDGTTNMANAPVAVLHLLFVHGQLANSSGVLGVAFRGDILAVFPDQTQGQITLSNDRVLESIYTHETGHLMGMVDEVLHDNRADPNDPNQPSAHNPDRGSVMYYAIDTTGLSTVFSGGPPIDFDAADYADFARLRAGG